MGCGQVIRQGKTGLLRNHQKTGRERVLVQLATGLHHTLVLPFVAKRIELVERAENLPAAMHGGIAFAGRDGHPGDQHTATELPARQVPRQVEGDAAARAAAQPENDAHNGVALRCRGARGKAAQRRRHRSIAVVIRLAVDRLGQRARHRLAWRRNGHRVVEPGLERGAALDQRVLEFKEAAVAFQGLRQRIRTRHGQGHRLDLRTLGREFGRQRAHACECVVADVDHQRSQPRAGGVEQIVWRVAQHLLDHTGTCCAHTHHMNTIRQRGGIGDPVHPAAQCIELALLKLGFGRTDGRSRSAAEKINSCSGCHESLWSKKTHRR